METGTEQAETGTQDGAADAAAAAQAVSAEGAGKPETGTQGGQPGAGADLFELTHNGQKYSKSREEAIALAQQGLDYTQKTQALAEERKLLVQQRKDYQARLLEIERITEEAKAGKAGKPAAPRVDENGQPEPEDETTKTLKELKDRQERLEMQAKKDFYEKTLAPVKAKYPELDDQQLLKRLNKGLQAGEWDDDAAGLMAAADAIEADFNAKVEARLAELLKKKEDPRIKALNEEAIAAYIKGKTDVKDAGGDKGPGGTGAAKKEPASIDEVADRYL